MTDIDQLREIIDERDRRYEQQFQAQATAVSAALAAQEKAVAAALTAADRAVAKAEMAAERRFESVNEFRGQLTDQAATFVSRVESETKFTAVTERFEATTNNLSALLGALAERVGAMEGKALGSQALAGYLIGAVGVVGAIVALFAR